jgi:predicted aspartyl protease
MHLELLAANSRFFGAYGLPVRINGGRPLKLIFDTGAGGILIHSKAAEKAGIERVASTKIKGIGDAGAQSGYMGWRKRSTSDR